MRDIFGVQSYQCATRSMTRETSTDPQAIAVSMPDSGVVAKLGLRTPLWPGCKISGVKADDFHGLEWWDEHPYTNLGCSEKGGSNMF